MTPPRETELTHGLRAGLAVFASRPADLVRVGFASEVRGEVAALVAYAKQKKLPCDLLRSVDLAEVAGTPHHEGLVLEAAARPWASLDQVGRAVAAGRGVAVALDRVRNPYNVGAILRTAAFLGVDAVLLGAPAPHPGLAPDAVRVAEGGAEHLVLSRTTDLAASLARLAKGGVTVVGADGGSTDSAFAAPPGRPVVLVVGNEREGLSPRVRDVCGRVVAIPGTGKVESLNVGVATGILMREALR